MSLLRDQIEKIEKEKLYKKYNYITHAIDKKGYEHIAFILNTENARANFLCSYSFFEYMLGIANWIETE